MTTESTHFLELLQTIRALRSQNGCPWDRKQTCATLTQYLKEESQELLEAINNGENTEICEELGDLLFIILLLCEINEEQELFTVAEMLNTINEKLIRRHPHVFANQPTGDEESLRKQWQEIKAREKEKKNI